LVRTAPAKPISTIAQVEGSGNRCSRPRRGGVTWSQRIRHIF
jgi:hypothetical protein